MKKIIFCLMLLASFKAQSQLDTSYKSTQIVLNIPNKVVDNTVIKRKAYLYSMVYNNEVKSLCLFWNVKHFSDSLGSYGDYLGSIIPDLLKQITADNTTMVNSNTGAFVYKDANGNYPQNIPYMGQYDFFSKLATYQPIIVNNLIISYGQQTDWDGK